MRDTLTRTLPYAQAPYAKITFFDKPESEKTLKKHIKTMMNEKGLQPPKPQEIIEENIKRQIARSLLCDRIEDQEIRKCLEIAMRY